ncbi:MAG: ADP-ribosylglycohydrolase family protein [Chloroflexi bacterium]|nr:ADP-ribosylglycohydrolase family protein [Chloroflexota bacterium]
MEQIQRYTGSLLGLAAGDAVGTAVEFKLPGSFTPVQDMVGGGAFRLKPGQWTDDTSMALCLAVSLIERRGYDPKDQMERFVRWWRDGYLSSTGFCFDIGGTVSAALSRYQETGEPYSGSTDSHSAGNGALMRLAPVPLFFAQHPAKAIEYAGISSRTTHGAAASVDACRYFGGLLVGAVRGATKEELLASHYAPVSGYWETHPLAPEINDIAGGSFKRRQPPEIRGAGYVVQTLEAALWAFYNSDDFRSGCLLAVNLGNDADTTAAVYGQLAGAYYGDSGIPAEWVQKLTKRELIESYANQLYELSQRLTPTVQST